MKTIDPGLDIAQATSERDLLHLARDTHGQIKSQ